MFVILLVIVGMMLFLVIPELLTGMSVIDAYLSSRGMNVSVIIDWTPPQLELILPENTTYPEDAVPVDWNATDEHSAVNTVWYNIDHGANITLTSLGNITVTEGSHTFYLFVNDSVGNQNSSSINFTTYEVEEPPEEPPERPGGGGGFGERGEENKTAEKENKTIKKEQEKEEKKEEKAEEVAEEEAEARRTAFFEQYGTYSLASLLIIIILIILYLSSRHGLFFIGKRRKKEKEAKRRKKRR